MRPRIVIPLLQQRILGCDHHRGVVSGNAAAQALGPDLLREQLGADSTGERRTDGLFGSRSAMVSRLSKAEVETNGTAFRKLKRPACWKVFLVR